MRTGQYKTINASVVHEGEVEDVDFITGEIIRGKRKSNEIIGYIAYFKLINGFEKTLYITKSEMEDHAKEFSQSYAYDMRSGKKSSVWSKNFNAMALKTVLKQLISKYGIMSVDIQSQDMAMAVRSDGAVVRKVGESYDYTDNPDEPEPIIEAETVAEEYPAEQGGEVVMEDIGEGLE